MKTYRAEVERDGSAWLVNVPQIDRVTQARNLREVEMMTRDLIEIMTGEPADSFELDVHITLPADVDGRLQHANALRQQAADSQAQAAAEVRAAARALSSSGLTLRDIGRALDVSYQRAHQLVNS